MYVHILGDKEILIMKDVQKIAAKYETFKGLESARRVYEAADFRLCEESDVFQWGQNIKEQKYELELSERSLKNR